MRGENGIRVKINERRERRERDKSEIYEVSEKHTYRKRDEK